MSFSDRDGTIWMDGEMVPWRDAKVHVLTHSLHYGLGVFEGVRAYQSEHGTAIFRLHDHTNRFFRSAHILGMDMPYDAETLNDAQKQVIRANNLEAAYIMSTSPCAEPKLVVTTSTRFWPCRKQSRPVQTKH